MVTGPESRIEPGRGGGARVALLSLLGAWTIRLLRATLRLRFHDDAEVRAREREGRNFILAFWHRHMLLMRYAYRGQRMNVLSSRSRDGEIMVGVLARLGIRASRGSTTRGGAAGLLDMVRRARAGWDLGVTPDGPRGPARVVQPGVILAAAATGLPIVPVAMAATRRRELATWDRMPVPLPFSRVDIVYGEPIVIPRRGSPEEWAPRLAAAIDAVEARAERLAAGERISG